jgi:hypothetical protein
MSHPEYPPTDQSLEFFERAMAQHRKVECCEQVQRELYQLTRRDGLSPLRVLLVNIYTVGVADVIELLGEFPGLQAIVILSNWNGYTTDAKEYAKQRGVGVFVMNEFLGALWQRDPTHYEKPDDKQRPRKVPR